MRPDGTLVGIGAKCVCRLNGRQPFEAVVTAGPHSSQVGTLFYEAMSEDGWVWLVRLHELEVLT